MFGHDDDGSKTDTSSSDANQGQIIKPVADSPQPVSSDSSTTDPAVDDKTPAAIIEPTIVEPKITPEKTSPTDSNVLSLGTDPLADSDKDSPADGTPSISLPEPVSGAPALPSTGGSGEELNGLLTIKQDALQQLSPLVDHLDQTPEEKFHTTMMMIQASDNQSLIQKAFEAAKTIADDKERAQALLDIINEINYFTQHQSTEQ